MEKFCKIKLAGANSDAVKTMVFWMVLSVLQVLKKSLIVPVNLPYAVESITNGLVGQSITFKLVGCQFKLPGHLGRLSDPICSMNVHVTCNSN